MNGSRLRIVCMIGGSWRSITVSGSQGSRKSIGRRRSSHQKRGSIAHVMEEKPDMAKAFVLDRGEYDKRLDEVSPGTPAAFRPIRKHFGIIVWEERFVFSCRFILLLVVFPSIDSGRKSLGLALFVPVVTSESQENSQATRISSIGSL